MRRPQRILVTGAAGFIGSTVVERLLSEGREVTGLDSFDCFYPEAQKVRNLSTVSQHPAFELVRGDIRDTDAIADLFETRGFDGIIHLAALAGVRPSLERPAEYADVNVGGTSVLLAACARHDVPQVIFGSSSSVYGERDDGPFRETDPVERPISPYAATKRSGELIAHTFHHAHGTSIACLRFFTVYGPRQRPDLAIRKFAERMLLGQTVPIYGDGSSLRDFTFVEDTVDGIVRALDANHGFGIYNLGAGHKVAILDVVKLLEQSLGISASIEWQPSQVGDVKRTWADISAAREAFGYEPRTTIEKGIERFVEWLRQST
ncbi:GDP-mannose 4,6-dehydratase [Myxococcota bacterium]|nr:GDP-mannose 4,6-dehydratase [Myxococcota bacterium]